MVLLYVGNAERHVVEVAGTREASTDREAKTQMRRERVGDGTVDQGIPFADLDRAGLGGGHGAQRAGEHGAEARVEVAAGRRDPREGPGYRLALAPSAVAVGERPAQQ